MSADGGAFSGGQVRYLAKPFVPGKSGNPTGKSKTYRAVRRLFQRALLEVTPNNAMPIAHKVIQHAYDDDSPKQAKAWDLMHAYGIGLPPKELSTETIAKLAEQMLTQMLAEARARAEEKRKAIEASAEAMK